MTTQSSIDLYTWGTPNGKKIPIALEELGLAYTVHPVDIGNKAQFAPDYLRLNPNNKIPALVDRRGSGAPVVVFESGAIMMYLATKAGKFYPQDVRGKAEVDQWLIWQMANQGPKLGECGHFRRLGDTQGDQGYAVRRFTDEANRLYGVLNNRLYDRPWLAGKDYTIADMISYPWTINWKVQGQDIEEFKHVKRWQEALAARPAVQRGMNAGTNLSVDVTKLPAEEQARIRKIMYNQRARPAPG